MKPTSRPTAGSASSMDPNARKCSQIEETTPPDNYACQSLLLEAEFHSRQPLAGARLFPPMQKIIILDSANSDRLITRLLSSAKFRVTSWPRGDCKGSSMIISTLSKTIRYYCLRNRNLQAVHSGWCRGPLTRIPPPTNRVP